MGVAVLSIRKDESAPVSIFRWLFVPAWLAMLVPAAAADIYIWTDDRGTTVISDTRPENPRALKNFEVVVRDADRGARKGSGPREATRTEQKLLDRIEELERQVRAQAYTSPPPAPAPSSAVIYSTSPPPPPAYDPFYSSGFFPPFSYVMPAPIVVRRSFGGYRHFPHRGAPHRGRR